MKVKAQNRIFPPPKHVFMGFTQSPSNTHVVMFMFTFPEGVAPPICQALGP